jgi:hypothetical protein
VRPESLRTGAGSTQVELAPLPINVGRLPEDEGGPGYAQGVPSNRSGTRTAADARFRSRQPHQRPRMVSSNGESMSGLNGPCPGLPRRVARYDERADGTSGWRTRCRGRLVRMRQEGGSGCPVSWRLGSLWARGEGISHMSGVLVDKWIDRLGGAGRVLDVIAAAFPDTRIRCMWSDKPEPYSGHGGSPAAHAQDACYRFSKCLFDMASGAMFAGRTDR